MVAEGGVAGVQADLPRFPGFFNARGNKRGDSTTSRVRGAASLDLSHLCQIRLVGLGIENKQSNLPPVDVECLDVYLAIHRQQR